jgi:hypothetical protein
MDRVPCLLMKLKLKEVHYEMPGIDSETLNLVKSRLKDPEILLSFRFITMKQSYMCIQGKTKKDAIVEAC